MLIVTATLLLKRKWGRTTKMPAEVATRLHEITALQTAASRQGPQPIKTRRNRREQGRARRIRWRTVSPTTSWASRTLYCGKTQRKTSTLTSCHTFCYVFYNNNFCAISKMTLGLRDHMNIILVDHYYH